MAPPIGYIAYIDESGDDGIKRVRPIDIDGGSEWFVISAFVVQIKDEGKVPDWHKDILAFAPQRQDIHFNKMSESARLAACNLLASTNARIFTAVSWKPSMRGHRNQRAETAGGTNVFYNWMVRILLERVTHYCHRHSTVRHRPPHRLRIIFSQRGGMRYWHTKDYLAKLFLQSYNKRLFINQYDLAWEVVEISEILNFGHKESFGLQLADVAAAAFYQALGETPTNNPHDKVAVRVADARFASLLQPRVATGENGIQFGTGLKLMFDVRKYHYNTLPLSQDQRLIFEQFGAPRVR